MPVVGSKLGQVYNNDQGKGLAVVLDTSGYWRQRALAQQEDLARERVKAKAKKEALQKLEDNRPDVKWPEYLNQIRGGYNELFEVAAQYVTETGNDVYTSPDETAREIRARMNTLDMATQRVNVLKGEHDKRMEDIGTRGDKYTQESIDEILNFTDKFSVQDMARGYKVTKGPDGKEQIEMVSMPELQFKNPSTLFNDFYVNGKNNLKGDANEMGYVPPEKIREYGINYFTAEENEHNLKAANQMYQKLDPNSAYAKSARAYASQMGMEGMPGMALAIMNLERSLSPDDINASQIITQMSKAAPVATSTREMEDTAGKVTKTAADYLTDKNYSKKEAESFLIANRYLLNDASFLAQLGIDKSTSGSLEETFQAARDAMTEMINDRIVTDYSTSTRYESEDRFGGAAKQQNFDDEWLARLYHSNPVYNKDAANWLVGLKLPGVEGAIGDAAVVEVTSEGERNAIQANKKLRITFEDEKTANQARAKAREFAVKTIQPPKDASGYRAIEGEELEEWKRQKNLFIKEMYQEAGGKVVTYPINDEFYQIFKNLHNEQVQNRGELYKSPYPPLGQDKYGIRGSDIMNLDEQ